MAACTSSQYCVDLLTLSRQDELPSDDLEHLCAFRMMQLLSHMNSEMSDRLARMADGRRRRSQLLMGANVVLGIVLFALAVWVTASSRVNHEDRARATAESLATIASSNLAAEFAHIDSVLRITQEDLERLGSRGEISDTEINDLLMSRFRMLPGVEGVRLADGAGKVRWGNLPPNAVGLSVADRDYFHKAKDSPQQASIVTGPIRSRLSGNWILVIARPVRLGEQSDGVLYASIGVRYFADLFQNYDMGSLDAITLRNSDLMLVARVTGGSSVPSAIGTTNVSDELLEKLATSPARGIYSSVVPIDGVRRTTAYRKVDGWPLVVFAGLNHEGFFQAWAREAQTIGTVVGFAWLLSCLATFSVFRFAVRDSEAVRALESQNRRTQTLMRVAGDGIHITDKSGHLLELSESFAEMLESTRDDLKGKHISFWDVNQDREKIDAWLSKVIDGDRQRVSVQHRTSTGRIIDVDLHWKAVEIEGELLIFGSARDVSETNRLLKSVEQSAARIRDLYDHAPCAYFSLDADGQIVHANAVFMDWLGIAEIKSAGSLARYLAQESREKFSEHFLALTMQEHAPEVEVWLSPPGGKSRRLRLTSSAVRDVAGSFLMSRTVGLDVSAQHHAQAQLESLLKQQSAMLNSELVGMANLDGDRLLWKNTALERMLGYPDGGLDGEDLRQIFIDENDFNRVAEQVDKQLREATNFRVDVRLKKKDGSAIWVDLNAVKLVGMQTFWMAVDISAAKSARDHIEHVAFHDSLTQLPNRLLLQDRLKQALSSAERQKWKVGVAFLDLDGFKAVNDKYGHDAGDEVLVEISRRITSSIRACDTAARLGGDEFVLVLAPVFGSEWRGVVKRVMGTGTRPIQLASGAFVKVGMTVGVALSNESAQASVLLTRADDAMLHAKRLGKNRVVLA